MEVRGNYNTTKSYANASSGWGRRDGDRKDHILVQIPRRTPTQVGNAQTETHTSSRPPSWDSRPSASSERSRWTLGSFGKQHQHQQQHSYLPAETVYQSTKHWGHFAAGGVKHDDLRREQVLDGQTATCVQVVEVDNTDSSGPSDRVIDMGDGRKKWIQTFHLPRTRGRDAQQEDLGHFDDESPPRDDSPGGRPESVNLIDLD